jgi:hypothetical protein
VQNDPIYKNMALWVKSNAARSSSLAIGDKPCLGCIGMCSIVPPSGSSFPCYEGEVDDTVFCYNTDPLLVDGSTTSCRSCAAQGYTEYMRNDPVYREMGLWSRPSTKTAEVKTTDVSGEPNCNRCLQDLCSIIPPAGVSYPCYQGTRSDTTLCYNTDPLLAANSTTVCGACSSVGYSEFLRYDPIYKNMQLWGK